MIEEPYRWVEAISNRREYIETQVAPGSPIAAVGCRDGIVLVTAGRPQQKVFEIYDRIAMGAIGHPGDIERLRMAAIELASTEGFTRSAADVSLRRLAYYSLSPMLKTAFEQVYGAPYLVRMLFAEVGETVADDLFVRVEYDGAIATNGSSFSEGGASFAAISGTAASTELMETFLQREQDPGATISEAASVALDAWMIGKAALGEDGIRELPERGNLTELREEQLKVAAVERAVLERNSGSAIRYRRLTDVEIGSSARR